MATIKDPSTGQSAAVDDLNRLQVFATAQDVGQSLNLSGVVFTAYAEITPTAIGDYFFYIKNTGTSNVAVAQLNLSSSVPTRVDLEVVSGTPAFVSESDAQVINNNLGSANPLLADVKYDTDITGLTSGGVLCFTELPIANTKYVEEIPSGIILPQGKAIALRCVDAVGLITIGIRIGGI